MDSKEIVDGLIRGSQNLDRMKQEIQSLVKTLLGCVSVPTANEMYVRTFDSPVSPCIWRIYQEKGEKGLNVDCWMSVPGAWGESLAYTTIPNRRPLRMRDVKFVHEGLSIFVNGMTNEFPGLSTLKSSKSWMQPDRKDSTMTREAFAKNIRWSKIIWTAGLVNVAAELPQLYSILRTHVTAGLKLEMIELFLLVQLAFAFHGFFTRDRMLEWCLGLSAAVSTAIICSTVYLRHLG